MTEEVEIEYKDSELGALYELIKKVDENNKILAKIYNILLKSGYDKR